MLLQFVENQHLFPRREKVLFHVTLVSSSRWWCSCAVPPSWPSYSSATSASWVSGCAPSWPQPQVSHCCCCCTSTGEHSPLQPSEIRQTGVNNNGLDLHSKSLTLCPLFIHTASHWYFENKPKSVVNVLKSSIEKLDSSSLMWLDYDSCKELVSSLKKGAWNVVTWLLFT